MRTCYRVESAGKAAEVRTGLRGRAVGELSHVEVFIINTNHLERTMDDPGLTPRLGIRQRVGGPPGLVAIACAPSLV